MAAHLHFVFLGDGHDALEEVRDALPVRVGVHRAGDRRGVLVLVLGQHELAVLRRAAALDRPRARNAEDGEVVLRLEHAGFRDVADLLADVVDVAIALRALAQKDRRHLGARVIGADVIVIGIMSSERPYDSTRSRSFVNDSTDHFSSIFREGKAAADVVAAEGGHHLQHGIRVAVLRADLEFHFRGRCGFRGRCLGDLRGHQGFSQRAGGHARACQLYEFATIHGAS